MIKRILIIVSILCLYSFEVFSRFNQPLILNGFEEGLYKGNKEEQILNEFKCNKVSYQVFYIDSVEIFKPELYANLKDSINNWYPKHAYLKKYDELENAIIKREKLEVYKTKDTLKIKLDNNTLSTVFTFDPKKDYDLGRRINAYYEKENLILIKAIIEEGGHYYLLNRKTGEQTYLIGKPIFSPDRKLIIAFNGDLDTGLTTNGIQLFKVTDDLNVELLCYSQLSRLEPNIMKWEDNHTLIFKFREWDIKYNKFKSLFRKVTFDIEL